MVEAAAEAHGSGWVHPEEVGAHVETRPGSDMWQIPSEAYSEARAYVFDQLVEKYGKQKRAASTYFELAVDGFESCPSDESLVELAIVLAKEGVKF
jgi:hypothetical protein